MVSSAGEMDDDSDEGGAASTPSAGPGQLAQHGAEDPHTRRSDGARQPISDIVVFERGERRITGWALNLSRGGLRAAVEEKVEVDEHFDITVGEAVPRPGNVVWVRAQKDGAIVGVAFSDTEGSVPPPPVSHEAD